MKKFLLLLSIFILSASVVHAQNDVLWTVESAKPGDASMIVGENLGEIEAIELYRLPDKDVTGIEPSYIRTIKPGEYKPEDSHKRRVSLSWNDGDAIKPEIIQQSDTNIKFVIPEILEYGVYAIKPQGLSYDQLQLCNQPTIDWLQGDEGEQSSPKGWIRVSGRNLVYGDKKAMIVFESKATGELTYVYPSEIYSEYSVEYEVPSYLEIGDYYVYAHNGYGGEKAWSMPVDYTITEKTVWSSKEFNVRDFGAKGDGVANDTIAFYKALEAAEKNGGGVVYVPRGRYFLTQALEIPRYTTLRGEGNNRAQLFWTDDQWEFYSMPAALIFGSDNFAVENLSLRGGRVRSVIVSDADTATAGNVFIRNMFIYFNPMISGAMRTTATLPITKELDENGYGDEWAIDIGGENVLVENSYVHGAKGPIRLRFAYGVTIKNNQFMQNYAGWCSFTGTKKCIVQENLFRSGHLSSSSSGFNTLYGATAVENAYFAHNTIDTVQSNDREAFTTDGGHGYYFDKILHCDGDNLVLREGTKFEENAYADYGVIITEGKGMGQYRTIVSNTASALKISSPFSIDPDSSSKISIVKRVENLSVVDNKYYRAGNMQFYGTSMRGVMDGNHMEYSGGINSLSGMVYSAVQPSYYSVFNNNNVSGGYHFHQDGLAFTNPNQVGNNTVKEPGDFLSGYARIQLRTNAAGIIGHFACVLRDNAIMECGVYGLTDNNLTNAQTGDSYSAIIFDGNYSGHNDVAYDIDAAVKDVLIYKPEFENIDNKYRFTKMSEDGRGITVIE